MLRYFIRRNINMAMPQSKAISRFYSKFNFDVTPSPPKLSSEQQKEFEELQRIANSQVAIEEYNSQFGEEEGETQQVSTPNLNSDIGGFHPEYLRTIPEFEGDTNPKTGEIGGPKQDPLKHGDEWAFNGRVTDF